MAHQRDFVVLLKTDPRSLLSDTENAEMAQIDNARKMFFHGFSGRFAVPAP
jgi:hypothetical protein